MDGTVNGEMVMLRIGEFSRLGQVSVRMLRHYDALGLLEPAGTDGDTGYRSYTIDQLSRLNRILALQDLGLSLAQIGRLLAGDLPHAELRGMLTMRRAEMEQQLAADRARLVRVEARLRQIETEDEPSPYEIVVKAVAAERIASTRAVVPTLADMPDFRCAMYDQLYEILARNHIPPSVPEYAFYHDVEYLDRDIDTETAVAIRHDADVRITDAADRLIVRDLPAVPAMASVIHQGSAYDIPRAITALYAWIWSSGQATTGPFREIHLYGRENDYFRRDPDNVGQIVVEIQLPLDNRPTTSRRTVFPPTP